MFILDSRFYIIHFTFPFFIPPILLDQDFYTVSPQQYALILYWKNHPDPQSFAPLLISGHMPLQKAQFAPRQFSKANYTPETARRWFAAALRSFVNCNTRF